MTGPWNGQGPFRAVGLGSVLAAIATLSVPIATTPASEVRGYVETTSADTTRDVERDGATERELDSNTLTSTANLEWFTRPAPNVMLRVGGIWEYTDGTSRTPEFRSETDILRSRPYFGIDVRNQTISASVTYRAERLQISDNDFRFDSLGAYVDWTPDRLPSLGLRFLENRSRDADRRTGDSTERSFRVQSRYDPRESVRLDYVGGRTELDDRIARSSTESTSHLLKVGFDDQFLDRRLTVSADAQANWRDVASTTAGTGEAVLPTFPDRGLFLLTDTPEFDLLGELAALSDGDRTTPAGPDLGLVPPGLDDRPRNLGVEYLDETSTSLARVWVDRDLPQTIASTFSWRVYVSEDNDLWTLHADVGTAPFGPFQNRFEIRYPEVAARFVKVVVAPLDPSVPLADDWPDILVTEIEFFLANPAADVETDVSTDEQRAAVSARVLLNRAYNAYVDSSYSMRTGSRRQTEWVLTNAVSFNRRLGSVYGIGGRAERNDLRERDRTDSFHRYSVRLSANPLRSLRHSVLLSGSTGSVDGLNSDEAGISFSSWARLYEGIEASISAGRSYIDRADGNGIEVQRLNASALIVPHPTVRFRLSATERSSDETVAETGERVDQFQTFREVSVTYSPVPAIYLYGSYERQDRDDVDPQDLREIRASFSPFPTGSLRFSVDLFEEYRPRSGLRNQQVTPTVRWAVRQGWIVEASYTSRTDEFVDRTEKQDTIFARLQVFF